MKTRQRSDSLILVNQKLKSFERYIKQQFKSLCNKLNKERFIYL